MAAVKVNRALRLLFAGNTRQHEAQWGEVGSSSGSQPDPGDGQRHRGLCLPVPGWMPRPPFLESGAVWVSQVHVGEVPIAFGVSQVQPSQPHHKLKRKELWNFLGVRLLRVLATSALPPGGCTQPLPANAHHCGLGKGTSESGALRVPQGMTLEEVREEEPLQGAVYPPPTLRRPARKPPELGFP